MRFEIHPYTSCSFCEDLSVSRECAVVAENEFAVAEINQRQYERGAMLVIPRVHRESVLDIESRELDGVYRLARVVAHGATKVLAARGMNIFQNSGRRAGQSEPHFHVHVVPRFEEDDPCRIFQQRECQLLSLEEQQIVAALIRASL